MDLYTTMFEEAAKKNKTVNALLCKRISELELGIYYEATKKKKKHLLDLDQIYKTGRYSHSDLWLVTT